jgi:hypothetical protein
LIGIYRVVRELGCGGMGAVYLATRADGKFEQTVAIKMLRREFNTARLRQNFRREKDILAALSHPNIATLLDTGTTEDGIPYLVMEYVEGESIDKFCKSCDLPLNARLKLFNKVCDAVAFAHRNLIIHRDLKPSNILVTLAGELKLLDFGISKLLDAQSDDAHTIPGLMTPEYASPEQIEGANVTTATDIYSLGLVLFKLLTGSFPFDLENKTNGNLLREITTAAPKLPSRTTASGLSSQELKGDLDNIVLKAIDREPELRYSSVEQLSADIWRFIDGEPILARPASFLYRTGKFYGRHKIAVVAGVLVLTSLFSGIAIALSQARTAREQARLADESRQTAVLEADRARVEKEKAEKLSRFMAKMISYANPGLYAAGAKSRGEAKVIDVLDEMGARIEEELPGEIDVQAELHHKFAEVYTILGAPSINSPRAGEADKKRKFHALRALELRKQFYGDYHELVAKDIFYSFGLENTTHLENARTLLYAIQMMRDTNPKNLNLPYMLVHYASWLSLPDYSGELKDAAFQAGQPAPGDNMFSVAERYYGQSIPMFIAHYGSDNGVVTSTRCRLAYVHLKQQKMVEFRDNYSTCINAVAAVHDEDMRKQLAKDVRRIENELNK